MVIVCQQLMTAQCECEEMTPPLGKGMIVLLLDRMYLEDYRNQPFGGFHIGIIFGKVFLQQALFE